MILTYEGNEMTVHLLPGCITVELKSDTLYEKSLLVSYQAIYIIEYDEIRAVGIKNHSIIICLNDGSEISLEVNDYMGLYQKLIEVLTSMGRY